MSDKVTTVKKFCRRYVKVANFMGKIAKTLNNNFANLYNRKIWPPSYDDKEKNVCRRFRF